MTDTTCNTCHQPIHFVPSEGSWYHDAPVDTLLCPAAMIVPEPVEI